MTVQLQPPNRLVTPQQVPNPGFDLGVSQSVSQQPNTADASQPQFNNFELQQLLQQQTTEPPVPPSPPQPLGTGQQGVEQYIQQFTSYPEPVGPQVQVVRRNLTVAEMLVVFILSCFFVGGIQLLWNVVPKPSVSIEWRS